jgi:LuxR family maltose regulon positive regulatory protein
LPGGYIRLFLDEGEAMRRLLADLIRSRALNSVLQAYAARLLGAFSAAGAQSVAPTHAPDISGLIEPLSGRELEVLRLLAVGQSNREIAASLVISVGTVKSHVNHILGKLAAHSRTQAIAHARTLELV